MARPSLSDRLAAAISFSVCTTVGVLAEILLLYVLYKHREKYHKKHTLYVLVWSLAFSDMGLFLVHYIVAIPLSLSGTALYGEGWLLVSLATGRKCSKGEEKKRL